MATVTLTKRDQEILILAWECMLEPPKINYKLLAERANLTQGSAATMWSNLKRKVFGQGPGTPKKAKNSADHSKGGSSAKPGYEPEGSSGINYGEEVELRVKKEEEVDVKPNLFCGHGDDDVVVVGARKKIFVEENTDDVYDPPTPSNPKRKRTKIDILDD